MISRRAFCIFANPVWANHPHSRAEIKVPRAWVGAILYWEVWVGCPTCSTRRHPSHIFPRPSFGLIAHVHVRHKLGLVANICILPEIKTCLISSGHLRFLSALLSSRGHTANTQCWLLNLHYDDDYDSDYDYAEDDDGEDDYTPTVRLVNSSSSS